MERPRFTACACVAGARFETGWVKSRHTSPGEGFPGGREDAPRWFPAPEFRGAACFSPGPGLVVCPLIYSPVRRRGPSARLIVKYIRYGLSWLSVKTPALKV